MKMEGEKEADPPNFSPIVVLRELVQEVEDLEPRGGGSLNLHLPVLTTRPWLDNA